MYFGKTYFSFKYGTFSTKELVTAGLEEGLTALALTNINTTCDAWDFVQYCQDQGIKPILGVEIRNENELLYILLAANNHGFRRINEFLSRTSSSKSPFLAAICLHRYSTTRPMVFIIYPLGNKAAEQLLDNERLGIQPSEAGKLLKMPLAAYKNKYIIRQPVSFQNKIYIIFTAC